MDKTVLQYVLAIVAIVALVVVNVFGVESEVLNMALTGVVTATAWGAVQRKQGVKEGADNNP